MMHTETRAQNITSIFKDRPALLLLFIGFLVRGIVDALVPPGFDEAYYGAYSFRTVFGPKPSSTWQKFLQRLARRQIGEELIVTTRSKYRKELLHQEINTWITKIHQLESR